MTDTYFARLSDLEDTACWLHRSDGGAIEPAKAGRPSSSSELVVFIPGTEVLAVPARLGDRGGRLGSSAAAFVIEDELSVDPQTMHAVVAGGSAGRRDHLVYAVSRALMSECVERCRAFDLDRFLLVPEQSVIAPGEDCLDLGDRLLHWVDDRPVAIEKAWPRDVLKSLFGDVPESLAVDGGANGVLARAYLQNGGVDLAVDPFALRRSAPIELDRFKWPAAAAAALLLVFGVEAAATTSQMDRLSGLIEARTVSRNSAVVPGAQVTNAKDGASGQMRMLAAALYGAIAETPGTRLQMIRYDATDNSLRATLVFPELGVDQALRDSLVARGLTADAGDLRTDDGRIVGDIRIGAVS
ncbi:MAG TPA: type II secretion system protein GspL [Hyphomonas sp.]|nr:hypothetical protein [Hyphomonas sp.]HPE48272.1 type II secretion system protein GspL [Hyphomonas sp.]